MERRTPEQHIARLLSEAEDQERALALHEFKVQIFQMQHQGERHPDWLMEAEYELRPPFANLLDSLYCASVLLIETHGRHEYLKQFYRKFGEKFDGFKAACRFETDHYGSPEPRNLFLQELRQFLEPFDVIVTSGDQYSHGAGVRYMERVLRNTAALMHQLGIRPTSEPQIYNAVRGVLKLIFPSAQDAPKGEFSKVFKTYKPDIVVPELAAVIEYKYVDSEEKLKGVLGEIADDVKGYTGNPKFNLYYAVFYLTSDFWGHDRYQLAWSEYKFPNNWIPIFVVGS